MKILIADDSRGMRQVIAHTLRQAGFTGHKVIEAGDGAEGLQKALDESPDVVLCDWNMPKMSGIDFLRELRGAGSEVPFGFITSEVSPEMRNLAAESGAAFLIGKPFTPGDFQRALDDYLD